MASVWIVIAPAPASSVENAVSSVDQVDVTERSAAVRVVEAEGRGLTAVHGSRGTLLHVGDPVTTDHKARLVVIVHPVSITGTWRTDTKTSNGEVCRLTTTIDEQDV